MLAACTTSAVSVSSASTTESITFLGLASVTSGEKKSFSSDEEKVALAVRFAPNLIAYYKVFNIEWVRPDGAVYRSGPVQTRYGSHQELAAELPLRGHPAAGMPGEWKVRLRLEGRLLVERAFRIEAKEAPPPADPDPQPASEPAVPAQAFPDRAPEE